MWLDASLANLMQQIREEVRAEMQDVRDEMHGLQTAQISAAAPITTVPPAVPASHSATSSSSGAGGMSVACVASVPAVYIASRVAIQAEHGVPLFKAYYNIMFYYAFALQGRGI